MNRFDNLKRDLSNQHKPNYIDISNIKFTMSVGTFLNSLTKVVRDTEPGPKLEQYVGATVERFFQLISSTSPDDKYFVQLDWLLNNVDYITALIQVLSNNRNMITSSISLICNELYYDYATQVRREPDPKLLGAYMTLTRVINNKMITKLSGYVPIRVAIDIAAAFNSTINEEIKVRRVNWVLVQNMSCLNSSLICYVYESIFTHMSQLFAYTMLDVYDGPVEDSEVIIQANNVINIAILTELNEMPMDKIAQVLINYGSILKSRIISENPRIRFSIRTLDNTFARITQALISVDPYLKQFDIVLP